MTRPWRRRDFLRTGAVALGGLAGCVGGRDDEPDTGTPTTRATTRKPPGGDPQTTGDRPTTRTGGSRAVELVPASVQSSFFYRTATGSLSVGAMEGHQFAFAEVRPRSNSPPPPSDFALVADGRHFWGSLAPGDVGGPHRLVERGRGYDHRDARPGWVAFEVPDPLDAESVALLDGDRKRPVGEAFLTALRALPAEFQLLEFDAPDQVSPDETFEVSAVVQNAGDGSGTFRACLDAVGSTTSPHRSAFAIPAGEQHEWTRTLDAPAGRNRMDVRFASPVEDRDVTVAVASETTEGSSD